MRQFFTRSRLSGGQVGKKCPQKKQRFRIFVMRFIRLILAVALMAGMPIIARCAEQAEVPVLKAAEPVKAEASSHEAEKHEGLPAGPVKIFRLGPVVITNSMLIILAVTAVIVIFAQVVSRHVKPIPTGAQNFAEWVVESLYNFLGEIVGPDLNKKTFWFFGSIFLFILVTNWFGLIPGVGTIGWGVKDAQGHFNLTQPLLRGGNADLNMTSAMAILFFALWIIWAIQANGVVGFVKHIFAPKGKSSGAMMVFMAVIFLLVGVLETISILFRPVSLSFRLFGNVFAGENMLESMMNLVPWLGWLIPLPFYFLEMLVGLVQALVFTLLTAVFTLLITQHDDDKGHGHGHEHAH
jgi:F-type H+-transporting ATPase subunit a